MDIETKVLIQTKLQDRSYLMATGCIEWQGALTHGYGRIRVNGRMYLCHRVAKEIEIGHPIDRKLDVCHSCDNPKCINVNHLFVGTRKENMIDASVKGRLAKPVSMRNCKLKENMIEDVMRLAMDGMSAHAISKRYQVSWSCLQGFMKRHGLRITRPYAKNK